MSIRLTQGAMAPQFSATDMLGQHIKLDDYKGRWLLLSFYRYASCPFCNLRVHELSKRQVEWQAQGLHMVGIFQSPEGKMQQFVGKQQPPFPLLADPEQKLYALYKVSHSWLGLLKAGVMRLPEALSSIFVKGFIPGTIEGGLHRIPADFVIDPQGRIIEVYYGCDIGDHLPVERINYLLHTTIGHQV